jgi:hypothetical protein
MGASGWTYEVAWQPDLQAALTSLCDEAFANGDYLKEWEDDDDWDFDEDMFLEIADLLDYEGSMESVPGLIESIGSIKAGGDPTNFEAASFLVGYSGFHSILDCPVLWPTPSVGAVSVLDSIRTAKWFGSPTPTSEAVRSGIDEASSDPEFGERGAGHVVVGLSPDGDPNHLFFFGFAGD